MKMIRVIGGAILGSTIVMGAAAQQYAPEAKSPSATASAAANTTDAANITDAQLCTMTVHEAWVASGRNEDRFFDLVKRVAEMSAAKRGVTLPDNQEAGSRFGNLVKQNTHHDPDQLLYAVVDSAVRQTAAGTSATK